MLSDSGKQASYCIMSGVANCCDMNGEPISHRDASLVGIGGEMELR